MVIPSMVKTAGTSSESATSELKRAENRRETHAFASDSETYIWNWNNNKTGMQKKKDEDTQQQSFPLQRGILQFRRRSREEANQF